MTESVTCCAAATLALVISGTASAREWTSASGKHKTEADLVQVNGNQVWLRRTGEKETITVELDELSDNDKEYIHRVAQLGRAYDATAPSIPSHIAEFIRIADMLREPEIARCEKRVSALRKSLRLARRSGASRAAKELTSELKEHTARMAELKSALIFLPQVSLEGTPGVMRYQFPDGLRGGQIGTLDDRFLYIARVDEPDADGEEPTITVSGLRFERLFERSSPLPGLPQSPGIVDISSSAPYAHFVVQGIPLEIAKNSKTRSLSSPLNLALTGTVFIVEEQPRGLLVDFVLRPYDMRPIDSWLRSPLSLTRAKKR